MNLMCKTYAIAVLWRECSSLSNPKFFQNDEAETVMAEGNQSPLTPLLQRGGTGRIISEIQLSAILRIDLYIIIRKITGQHSLAGIAPAKDYTHGDVRFRHDFLACFLGVA